MASFDLADDHLDIGGVLATILLAVVLQLGAVSRSASTAARGGSVASRDGRLGRGSRAGHRRSLFLQHAVRLRPIRGSVALGAGFLALVLMLGIRYLWHLKADRSRRLKEPDSTRLLVFCAGAGGTQIITAMLGDPHSPYLPVGLLDDDPHKRDVQIGGVSVIGTRHDLKHKAKRLKADAVLIAIPTADSNLVAELSDLTAKADLNVKIVPAVRELFAGTLRVADIRDIDLKDFFGRHQFGIDVDAIAGYLTGKRVLVTGAGGSIGSELCRQINRFGPAKLIMFDRNEDGLHAVQLSLEGRAMLDTDAVVLGDIRDSDGVNRLFAERKPEVIFHAAALNHLPMLERSQGEAVKTNVWGTLTMLDAAATNDLERVVNISTDKAADPVSVLGYTKRITERLTAHFATTRGQRFMSVRFGNLLESRGSVINTFRIQVEAGEPLTVTDPEVTRCFMTVDEAVELVIQAGAIGRSGDVLVLDMGKPVRIADIAHRMASQAKATRASCSLACAPARSCTRCCWAPVRWTCGQFTR